MKKNKHSVKILSLILVLVMAFSLVPVSASAESYRGGSAGTNGWSDWWNWGWGGWWNWGWDDPEPEPEPEEPVVEEPTEPTEPEEPVVEEPTEPEEPVIESDEGSVDFETDNYIITVTYTKEAQIPVGTKLTVREIKPFTEEYTSLWNETILKLNNGNLDLDELHPDARVGLTTASFFDVTLKTDDGEFEPAVPLQVNIHFKEGGLPQLDGEESGVIHFGANGTELIEDVNVSDSGESTPAGMPDGVLVDDFTYMQDGFSIVGAYTTGAYTEPAEKVNTSFAPLRDTNDDEKIAVNKSVTDEDGDGIYDLKLSVTGNSNKTQDEKLYKSNVVLVIDVSGSMKTAVDQVEYVYSPSSYDEDTVYFFTYGQRSFRVWHDGVDWYSYYNDGTKVYIKDLDIGDYTVMTNYSNRLEATKAAARALVRNLLANNKDEDGKRDIIQISLEKFADKTEVTNYYGQITENGTKVLVSKSTDETTLINAINGLQYNGGTHWQAALQTAKTEIDSYEISTDPKVVETNYVIFLTDGFPTMWGNDEGGAENDGNVSHAFNEALTPAQNIVDEKTTFFTIFAYGSADKTYGNTSGTYNTGKHTGYQYLCGLTNNAYDPVTRLRDVDYSDSDNCFDASNTSALQDAFKKISDKINNNVGFGGVAISDGLSVGSTNSTIAVDGTVHPESFVYTVYDTENNDEVLYTVTFNAAGTVATFKDKDGNELKPVTKKTVTTELPDPTETDPNHTRTVTKDVFSVNYGTGAGAKVFKMTPATIAENGMIDWDLSGLGILEKWTYELSFKVWPNQAAYDIAADLNNGLYNGDLNTAIADYVEKGLISETEGERLKTTMRRGEDGKYVVSTNYSQNVTYHQAEIEQVEGQDPVTTYGNPQSDQILPVPNPIPLTGSLIPMEKRWGADLAISELQELVFDKDKNNKYTGYKVVLNLKRDGADYMSYTFPKLNADNQPVDKNGNVSTDVTELVWQQDGAIAPGRMVTEDPGPGNHKSVTLSGDKAVAAGVAGTYYIINDGHEYVIEEGEGSDLHFEFETETYHPMLVNGQLMNIKFSSVGTNGVIADGATAEVIDPNMTSVFATNTLKGGLNIRKVVTGPDKTTPVADCTDEFTFKVTLTNNGAPYGTPADQYTETQPADTTGWKKDETDPEHPFWYKSGFSAYNVYVRGADGKLNRTQRGPIPANGELTLTMPANGEIRVVNLPTGTNYTVQEVVGNGGEYTYFKTVSAIKKGEDANGNDILEEGSTESTANTVSGTVVGNKANLETYYNYAGFFYVYHSSNNRIEKISFADSRVTGTYENGAYKYTFNIADEVADNTLYGGYYHAYKGATINENQGATLTYTDNWAEDTNGTAYSYQYIKDQNRSVWDLSKAYTTEVGATGGGVGTAMKPVVNQVYFLKEVPDGYLRPYNHYTYYKANNKIASMWIITALDDCCYQEAYFKITDVKTGATVANSVTIKAANSKTSTKLTADTIFKTSQGVLAGYIAHAKISDKLGQEILLEQFWTTPDGVDVHGAVHRTLDTSGNYGYKGKTHFTDDPYQP